jgi:hypothetical protein
MKFHTGGVVKGHGMRAHEIPVLLSREHVIPTARMRQLRLAYLDIVPTVHRQIEQVSPQRAHEHAMRFVVIDALNDGEDQ